MKKAKPAPKQARKPAPSNLLEEVEALAEVLRRHDLTELEVEQEHSRILVRRSPEGVVTMTAPMHAPAPQPLAPAPAQPGAPAPKSSTSDGNVSYVTSPFVGTFYRSPSPDTAPFVDEGTRVKKGQVICIVEAMKLMNEIEAEIDGVVVQCLVDNGHPVEYGEPLFKIKQG